MSARFRVALLVGCVLLVGLHAPRCFESLAGADAGDPSHPAVAALQDDVRNRHVADVGAAALRREDSGR